MSYEIIYDKQFIKLDDETVIPMILAGSSNCFEAGRKGRNGKGDRSWWCITNYSNKQFYVNKLKLLEAVNIDIEKTVEAGMIKKSWEEKARTREEVLNSYGYHTSLALRTRNTGALTADKYFNFFKNGIRKAMTIEQLAEIGIHLQFSVYRWHTYKFSKTVPLVPVIDSVKEFYRQVKIFEKYKNTCIITEEGKEPHSPSISLYFDCHDDAVTAKLKSVRYKKKRSYKYIEQPFYYTLENDRGYLHKYTKFGYRYSSSWPGKQFPTENMALSYKNSLIKLKRMSAETWNIVKIDKSAQFKSYE